MAENYPIIMFSRTKGFLKIFYFFNHNSLLYSTKKMQKLTALSSCWLFSKTMFVPSFLLFALLWSFDCSLNYILDHFSSLHVHLFP